MATKHLVPRGDGEGGIGNSSRSWGEGHFKNLHCSRSLAMPVTDTAGRPSNPTIGAAVFDTDIGGLVIWNGGQWVESGVPSPKTLLITTDPADAGTVTGGGTYDKNTDVAISATANTNYSFLEWQGDVTEVRDVNENPTLVKMTQSWSIVAKFSIAQYDLTVEASPIEGGTATGGGTYDYGSVIDITANPDTANGYLFSGWTGDGITDSSSSTTTVLVDGDKTVTANFALETYDLTINTVIDSDADDIYEIDTSGTVGTTSGAGTSIAHGSAVNITATVVDNSYEFKGWEGSGVTDPNSPTTTVTVTSDSTLNAKFGKKTYTIDSSVADFNYSSTNNLNYTLVTGDGSVYTFSGDASGSNPNLNATTGDTLTFTNNTGGHPLGIYNSSGTLVASESLGVTTFTPNSTDTYYYQCTVSGHESMRGDIVVTEGPPETPGSLSVGTQDGIRSGTGPYLHSDTVYFLASVDSSYSSKYEFSHWSGDVDVLDDPNSSATFISSIDSNVTLVANFVLVKYDLTVDYELYDGTGTALSTNQDSLDNIASNLTVSGSTTQPYGSANLPVSYSFSADASLYIFMGWDLPTNVADAQLASTQLSNELTSNLTLTAKFRLATQELYVSFRHLESTSYGVNPHTYASYDYDVLVNGVSVMDGGDYTLGTGSVSGESNGEGVVGDDLPISGTIDAYKIIVDAFSTVNLSSDFSTSSRGLITWNIFSSTGSTLTDPESPSTVANIVGDTWIVIDSGLNPLSTFLVSSTEEDGGMYFGSTIQLTDISAAPSGDGTISSVSYTTDPVLTLSNGDTAIRSYYNQNNYISLDNVGDNIFNFNENFTILFNGNQVTVNGAHDFFSRGHFGMGGYDGGANQLMHYSPNIDGTSYRCAGTNMPATWKTSQGFMQGGAAYMCSATTGTYGTFYIRAADPGTTTIRTYSTSLATNYGAPADFVSQSSDAATHPFIIGNWAGSSSALGGSPGALFKDFLFVNRILSNAEVDEFINMKPGSYDQLSFYGEVVDWVELGAQTYPNITGKKGVVTGSLNGPSISESHFKTLSTLTLPSGSPGDTTGSVDVTLTVTDNQGLTDTDTQTITYGLSPLDSPELESYNKHVQTADGLYILGSPGVLEVETEVNDGGVTLTETYL